MALFCSGGDEDLYWAGRVVVIPVYLSWSALEGHVYPSPTKAHLSEPCGQWHIKLEFLSRPSPIIPAQPYVAVSSPLLSPSRCYSLVQLFQVYRGPVSGIGTSTVGYPTISRRSTVSTVQSRRPRPTTFDVNRGPRTPASEGGGGLTWK